MRREALVRGHHVAERGAVVEHVVPGERRAVPVARGFLERQVGDEPRRVVECGERLAQAGLAARERAPGEAERRRPHDVLGVEPDRAVLAGEEDVEPDLAPALLDPVDERVAGHRRRVALEEAPHDPAVALRPREHRLRVGVLGVPVAAREVVDAGPGRDVAIVAAVVVAAGVVDEPVDGAARVALGDEPVAHRAAVEREQFADRATRAPSAPRTRGGRRRRAGA